MAAIQARPPLVRSQSADFYNTESSKRHASSPTLRRRGSHDYPFELVRKESFKITVDAARENLLTQEDTDNDGVITIDDRGPKAFSLATARPGGCRQVQLRGTYALANLLQELVLAQDLGQKATVLNGALLAEDPVERVSRRIRDLFWDNLSRRLDRSLIAVAAKDPKDWTNDQRARIYIPHGLKEQYEYYQGAKEEIPGLELDVCYLPPQEDLTAEFVQSLNEKPGVLALQMRKEGGALRGLEFVVPGGIFNELYGWDSYFCALGLLENGRAHTARDITLNFCFEIEHYGMILNATRTYYLGRTQPPFLTDLALRTYSRIRHEPGADDFLRTAILAAIKEYSRVWMSPPRFDEKTGLSRYCPHGAGLPPEVEVDFYDYMLQDRAKERNVRRSEFVEAYNKREIEDLELDRYFLHDRAVRESGHDTSYRVEGICADLATIDLNALLYRYETDIAHAIKTVFHDQLEVPASCLPTGSTLTQVHTSSRWTQRAYDRKSRINRYLWNEQEGMFTDYNTRTSEQTPFKSVTCLWVLWSGLASSHQAELLVTQALPHFEHAGGLSSTAAREQEPDQPQRQWDHPFGWAPHQVMAWDGLRRYGYHREAERLAYRWLRLITNAAIDFNGVIVEKYNVTNPERPHEVDAEYGNQGRVFQGLAREGFGWTNASYVYGLKFLGRRLRRALSLGVTFESVGQ